ncbi:hypothetical protein N7462_003495 [Penicillium macrosclerotiorum]|uniref:uncharacterized protein n=1 Tax=Penicillium macrosclerotiorum TaxID=303699 RepID=UPI002548929D|nr:uncharacterized protein N7462_003495 [Penicillium macrosclerotiorum]KAJ5689103.1 hypothetical protein N7462_003495 [Penicillium macrosclerotiorum]
MQLPPLAVMASWPTPNYTDPTTRGHGVLIVNIICIGLAFLVVMLRLYTRLRITCSAGIDDILIVIGLVFAIAMVVITSVATENWGWNRHIWDVPTAWLSIVQKMNLVFQIMFSWSSSITKISLLWFCRRLLGAGKGNFVVFNWAFIGSMIFVGLSCLLFTFISIFQCSPVKAYWDVEPTYPNKCMDNGAIVFSASVINIFTDFMVTALPMPLIWSLKLPARQRLAVISIFALGIVVNVAGSVRTVYVWKSMVVGYDTTWVGWPVLIAASVEINLGLICSSAPALRPLIATFLPRLLNSTQNISYNKRSHGQKLWSSTGRSRTSHMPANDARHGGYESDRFEIMRTVEMESWTESRLAHHDEINPAYGVSTNTRAISPESIEMKQGGTVFSSAASGKSSSSLRREDPHFPGRY